MKKLDAFIRKLEQEFDEIKPGTITPDTDLQKIADWNSMNILVLMALIKTETGKNISAQELRKQPTLRKLFKHLGIEN